MTTAMQAGDIGGIQKILKERFPGLEFETMGTEMEEVDKPAEASVAATPTTPVVGDSGERRRRDDSNSVWRLYGRVTRRCSRASHYRLQGCARRAYGSRQLQHCEHYSRRSGRNTGSAPPAHLAPEADQLTTHPLTTVIRNNITATITAAMSTMALSVVPQIQPQQPLQPKRSPLLNPKPGLRPRGPRHKSRSRRQSVKPAPAKWHRQLIEVLMCLLVVPLRLQERKLHINGLQNEWNPRVTSVSWQPLAVEEKN
jgi:hypothetical protein